MDKKIQILLNSKKNLDSVDKESYITIGFEAAKDSFQEMDITKTVNASEIYYKEREECKDYRFYGRIEYLSLLNNLKKDYTNINDLFIKSNGNLKNLLNSFDLYILKPNSVYSPMVVSGNTQYIRNMVVIATPSDFDVFKAGFSNNVFGDDVYTYVLNKDINIENSLDNGLIPLTEVFLYLRYKTDTNEKLYETRWDSFGNSSLNELNNTPLLNGALVTGDIVEFNMMDFKQNKVRDNKYVITTLFTENNRTIAWDYNPLMPIRLRYLSSELRKGNISTTSYDLINSIPDYAYKVDGQNNYIWRNILSQGNFDPITEEGVDFPFVNKKNYIFSTIFLSVNPDLSNVQTNNIFEDLKYDSPVKQDISPNLDVNNIGKQCL